MINELMTLGSFTRRSLFFNVDKICNVYSGLQSRPKRPYKIELNIGISRQQLPSTRAYLCEQ